MCDKILKVKFVCVGITFLTFDILLQNIAAQKIIGNNQ